MNWAQWIAITVPIIGVYLLFTFTAEEKGKVDRRSNAFSGLFIVPFVIVLMPMAAIAMLAEVVRKRPHGWGGFFAGVFILALYAGIAWLVYALRTIPIEDIPVE